MPLDFTPISQLFPTEEPCKIRVRIARLWGYHKPERSGQITGLDMILMDEKEAFLDQLPAPISFSSDHSASNAIQEAQVDRNPAAISHSSELSAAISHQPGNSSFESTEQDVFTDPITPIQKRPLAVVVEDEAAEHSATKRATPQSVNKPKKLFVKKEKKN